MLDSEADNESDTRLRAVLGGWWTEISRPNGEDPNHQNRIEIRVALYEKGSNLPEYRPRTFGRVC